MTKNTDQGQVPIPGVNRKKYAYDALLKENPTPSTMKEAEAFLRKHCDMLIKWKPDHDFLRIVLKDNDVKEEKEKHEYTRQLNFTNREEWEKQFIEVVQAVHYVWLDMQGPKYES